MLALLTVAVTAVTAAAAQYRDRQTWEERDQWSRPAEVLDALHVKAGATVADVGAGEGYFTVKLAERVGTGGKVYAVDIDAAAVANLKKLAAARGLKQVEAVEGAGDDPHLPAGSLDAILVVNAYHEFRQHDAMLRGFLKALKPEGRLGLIDKVAEREAGQSRESYERQHRLPEEFVQEDLKRDGFVSIHDEHALEPSGSRAGERWWFVVAGKPAGECTAHNGVATCD